MPSGGGSGLANSARRAATLEACSASGRGLQAARPSSGRCRSTARRAGDQRRRAEERGRSAVAARPDEHRAGGTADDIEGDAAAEQALESARARVSSSPASPLRVGHSSPRASRRRATPAGASGRRSCGASRRRPGGGLRGGRARHVARPRRGRAAPRQYLDQPRPEVERPARLHGGRHDRSCAVRAVDGDDQGVAAELWRGRRPDDHELAPAAADHVRGDAAEQRLADGRRSALGEADQPVLCGGCGQQCARHIAVVGQRGARSSAGPARRPRGATASRRAPRGHGLDRRTTTSTTAPRRRPISQATWASTGSIEVADGHEHLGVATRRRAGTGSRVERWSRAAVVLHRHRVSPPVPRLTRAEGPESGLWPRRRDARSGSSGPSAPGSRGSLRPHDGAGDRTRRCALLAASAHLLAGFDGSAPATSVVHWAAAEAVRRGVGLDVLAR